jgi:3-isopropylmalate dehydratase small subunit
MKSNQNLTINKLVELLREEQAKVEIDLVQINMGTVVKRKIKQQIKDDRLYYLCKNYDKSNILEYLNNISLNFGI